MIVHGLFCWKECSKEDFINSIYRLLQGMLRFSPHPPHLDILHIVFGTGGWAILHLKFSSTSFQTSPSLVIPSFTTESTPANPSIVSPSGHVATCSRVHTYSTSRTMVTPSVVEPLVSGSDGSIVHVEPTNDDFSDDTPQLSLETGVHSPLMDEIDVAPQVEGSTFE
ncbi:hypothetical protein V6N11_081275 [Hibiscus sabdariffa]|uniref:Uncharacterized protein n=1 Tax=Hibiscus sabdariffa TaxID=183260 RepID=A0ABR2QJU1_9ROSI